MPWLVRLAIVLAAGTGLCACVGGSTSPAVPGAAAAAAIPTQAPLAPVGGAAPKTPLNGLLDMQDISWHNTDAGLPTFVISDLAMQFPGVFGGTVINAAWSQMQPTAGGPVDFSVVDADLAQVRSYNSANPNAPLGVKLRIYGGNSAPQWAKQIGGPITIYRNPAGCDGAIDTCPLTIGAFWTAPYVTAWQSFQAQVAAKYDSEPLIRAVAVTSCASQTDEPFVATTGPVSKTNLGKAGYSDPVEQACLTAALADYAPWKTTQIDFTFNSYNKFTGGLDPAFTESVMTACRSTTQGVGSRCVLDNHALTNSTAGGDMPIYQAIQSAGGLINFQTQSPVGMGCIWTDTIAEGVSLGARAIEVWPEAKYQGFDSFTLAQVQQLAAEFTTPIPVAGTAPLGPGCTGFH